MADKAIAASPRAPCRTNRSHPARGSTCATSTPGCWSAGWCATMSWSRSEEHTSALQSLMRISYAVFCLKKKNKKQRNVVHIHTNNKDITQHKLQEKRKQIRQESISQDYLQH